MRNRTGSCRRLDKAYRKRFETDIKEIWISSYENVDGDIEFVIDILRNNFTLRSLSYIEDGSELVEKSTLLRQTMTAKSLLI